MESGSYLVRKPEQIQALAAPARLEIIEALQVHGASSIAEVARVVGRRPDSLYYHARILQNVGLLREVSRRSRARTYETVYDLPGRPLRIDYRLTDRRVRRAVVQTVESLLRSTSRDFRRAAEAAPSNVEGRYRKLWGARLKGRVTRSQLAEINAHLGRIGEILTSPAKDRADSDLMAATFVLLPLEPSRHTKKGVRSPARTPKEVT